MSEREHYMRAVLDGWRDPIKQTKRFRIVVRSHAFTRPTWDVQRFPEGTIYRAWCAWLFVCVKYRRKVAR